MPAHKDIAIEHRHAAHNFEFADEAARLGATGLTAADIGKIALQLDTKQLYALVATTPDWNILSGAEQAAADVPFTPDGDIAATDVQAAIVEVRDDTDTKLSGKANTAHTHAASDIDSGVLADGRVQESNVTQHEAAINHDALTNWLIGQHRIINDGGTSTIELLSASKINALVSALQAGASPKESVRLATIGNNGLTGLADIDGKTPLAGDRIGTVEQTDKIQNGIYIAAAGAWTRALDFDGTPSGEVRDGVYFKVSEGDTRQHHQFMVISSGTAVNVGTDTITFDESVDVAFGTTAGTVTEGNDSRVPTQDENDALLGTEGAPNTSNRYVTNSDSRNSDTRDPKLHADDHVNSVDDIQDATAAQKGLATASQITKLDSGVILKPTTTPVTDNALARWDGVTGLLIQDSSAILSDSGVLTGISQFIATRTGGGSTAAFRSVSISPAIEIRKTDAALDEKSWDWIAGAGDLQFRAVNDVDSAAGTYMKVQRTGVTINSVEFPNGNVIVTTGPLQVLGAGGEPYSRFGTNTTGHGLGAADDLLVSGKVEFDDTVFFDGSLTAAGVCTFTSGSTVTFNNGMTIASAKLFVVLNNAIIVLGSLTNTVLDWSTSQTNASVVWGLGNTSNTIIFTRTANANFNFLHADQATPTVFIHSAAQATDEWISFTHRGSSALITTGNGALVLDSLSSIIRLDSNIRLALGSSNNALLDWSSAQTNASVVWGLGNTSNTLIITQNADADIDFMVADQTNPTIYIHSANATTLTQNIMFSHNQVDGLIRTGTGGLRYDGALQIGGATAALGYSRFGTNVTGHSLAAADDLLVTGGLEVDSASFFDAVVTHNDSLILNTNKQIILGTSSESQLDWSAAQSNPSVVWGLGTSSKTIMFVEAADSNTDFGHANQPNPTIIIQSADATSPEQHLMLTHDQTSVVMTSGFGGFSTIVNPYSGTPGTTGSGINVPSWTFTDNVTAQDGTTLDAVFYAFQIPTLSAINTGVITTDASTVYIAGPPTEGTNQTITNTWSFWVNSGKTRLDDDVSLTGTYIVTASSGAAFLTFLTPGQTQGSFASSIDDGLLIAPRGTEGSANHNVIITSLGNITKDHDHDTLSTDPTLIIHSATDPDTSNTQWGSFTFNQTDFLIATGSGGLRYDGAIQIGGAVDSVAYSRLGTGVAIHGLTAADDLLVSGIAEFDSSVWFDGSAVFLNNTQFGAGLDLDNYIKVSQSGENQFYFMAAETTRNFIFASRVNLNKDFDHGASTNPTWFLHSATDPDTDNTQWMSQEHDQTNGVYTLGTGAHIFVNTAYSGTPGTTGSGINVPAWTFTDDDTAQDGTAAAMTFYSFQAPTLAAENTGVVTTNASTVYIAGAPIDGTNQTITSKWSLWVAAGNSRFSGSTIFDGNTRHQDNQQDIFGSGNDSAFRWNLSQAPDNLTLGLNGPTGNAFIICEIADDGFDFAHGAETDPTLFIHSNAQSTTNWISFAHNDTDGVIATGAGALALNPVGNLVVSADVEIRSTDAFHYGNPGTDTTWKTVRDGTKLSFQRRESGSYVEKGFFDSSFHTTKLVLDDAADGIVTGLTIRNSQAPSASSLNETAEIIFGFGTDDVARITADKLGDYTTTDDEDARLGFWVDIDGALTEIVHVMNDGLMLIQPGSNIRFVGTAGGSGSIQYKDTASSNRAALMFKDDIVGLVNRTVDGVIEIRPNSAAGGNSGEVTVATFKEVEVVINEDAGDINFRVEGLFDANLLVTDAGNDNVGMGVVPNAKRQLDIGGLFNGNTRLSLTDTLSSDAQAQQLFVGGNVEAAENQSAHGVRINPTLTKFGSGAHDNFDSVVIVAPIVGANGASLATASTLRIEGSPTGATKNFALLVHGLTHFGGDVKPEDGSTYDLGNSSTLKWANVWADLINGSDFAMSNKWRMLESELYEGYPEGWALGHDDTWEDGESVFKNPDMITREQRPIFAVTDEFIEYKGRRLTPAILDKLLALVE